MDKIINFSDISKLYSEKYKKEDKKSPGTSDSEKSCDLGSMPCYPPVIRVPMIEAKSALREFHEKYGDVKSAKYLEALKKHCIPNTGVVFDPEHKIEKYSPEYDKLCTEIIHTGISGRQGMCEFLDNYIAKNGNYIESAHCALLTENMLKKKGVKTDILCMKDKQDETEHYFTVINMDNKADVKDPYTWGKNAVICDTWANICLTVPDMLDYYEDLFCIEDGDYSFDYM